MTLNEVFDYLRTHRELGPWVLVERHCDAQNWGAAIRNMHCECPLQAIARHKGIQYEPTFMKAWIADCAKFIGIADQTRAAIVQAADRRDGFFRTQLLKACGLTERTTEGTNDHAQ